MSDLTRTVRNVNRAPVDRPQQDAVQYGAADWLASERKGRRFLVAGRRVGVVAVAGAGPDIAAEYRKPMPAWPNGDLALEIRLLLAAMIAASRSADAAQRSEGFPVLMPEPDSPVPGCGPAVGLWPLPREDDPSRTRAVTLTVAANAPGVAA